MKTLNSRLVFGVLFLLLLILISFWMARESRKNGEPVEILIAAQDIPAGSFINPSMVVISQCPAGSANPEGINDLHELEGLTTRYAILKGAQINYTQFSPSDKAKASSRSHNPQNYTFMVDMTPGVGRLFRPGVDFYFYGRVNGKARDLPLMVFQKVKLAHQSHQSLKSLWPGGNTTRLLTVTPAQAQTLKNLEGRPLEILVTGASGDEIVDISSLKD